MRKLFVALSLIISAGAWSQTLADPKSISIMGVPLEGPDSVFIPALDSAGVKQVHPEFLPWTVQASNRCILRIRNLTPITLRVTFMVSNRL